MIGIPMQGTGQMSSRLVALSTIAALALGACAHDGSSGGEPSVFEQLFSRSDAPPVHEPVTIPVAAAPGPAPVHIGATDSWGEPRAVPAGLVGPKAVASTDGPYLLDTGDRLRIFVYGQPNLSRLYIVDHDGKVTVPLIGAVKARGQTTYALEGSIRSRLGSQFVKDPQVTVDVQQNRPFFILGEVRTAGQFPYVSGMTIETAVAIAGGYSERANERRMKITRRIDGLVEVLEVPPDYVVQPGDTVYVYERFF
jgi:polysaccharide biosynthesis/export protein